MVTDTNHALVQFRSGDHKLLNHSKSKGDAIKLKATKTKTKELMANLKEQILGAAFR